MPRIALVALLALAGCQLPVQESIAVIHDPWQPVRFLSGTWHAKDGTGTSLESWGEPCGNAMYGQNRSINGKRLVFFELLTIERRGDSFVYLASPKGSPATEFVMTSSGVNNGTAAVTFENPEHDFPKRISYRLNQKGALSARVDDGSDGGKNLTFQWQRVN
ncbi:MAG: hypothetical protein ACI89X_004575 [Planctomycetota bacterium]|jgi:hypothetical protein